MITRFAPSPTGPLHLGHAYAAIIAHDLAQQNAGTFLLRIEDIDQSRARPHWEQGIYDDLQWLGLDWGANVMRQSDRMDAYDAALDALWDRGLLYPCTCTRRDITNALSAPQEGVTQFGPDGPIYPGTCRTKPRSGPRPRLANLRLDMQMAAQDLTFYEAGPEFLGTHHITAQSMIEQVGDVVLARKDMGTSYHLSVVVDDATQRISHVTRGLDLFDATKIHILLQHLLEILTPMYHHHRLIRDDAGKRLAKRDDARALSLFRDKGVTPLQIRAMVGL